MGLYKEIKKRFEECGNDEVANKKAAYMRNKFKFYGIAAPQRRAVVSNLFLDEKKGGSVDWNFADDCWDDDYREFQYVVIDYLRMMQKWLRFEDVSKIERFIRTKQWWDTIDGLDRIIGNIAFIDSRIDGLMLKWSEDSDFWVRRVAIDHQLCRKGKTNCELLETILVNNFGSSEFFINKAIGWSLRDYSKTDPEWVRRFLDKYSDRMNSLSIREASKYI